MKRREQFSSPEREVQPKKAPDVDWSKCFICQEDSADILRCPLNSKSCNVQESYTSLVQRIRKYKYFKELPSQMDLESLEDGAEIGKSLPMHGAKYHKLEHMENSNIKNEIGETQIDGPTTRSSSNQILKIKRY